MHQLCIGHTLWATCSQKGVIVLTGFEEEGTWWRKWLTGIKHTKREGNGGRGRMLCM